MYLDMKLRHTDMLIFFIRCMHASHKWKLGRSSLRARGARIPKHLTLKSTKNVSFMNLYFVFV
jgi:hypothetical protein